LYLKNPDGNTEEITGDFHHAMNGSFGVTPDTFTFMAIDNEADEWDIYVSRSGKITNLTKNSGFRNEDPKWSPDGKSIIFKRGHWDNSIGDFKYDLAVIDADTGTISMLTDDCLFCRI
jgi:Tol biopolymer transport system component